MPLFVVATPIGNLGDITFRAVESLKNADLVACEDTRRTLTLLNHLNIRKPLVRYDDHNHERALNGLLDALAAGKNIALVTDAGTPGVSDPGNRLAEAAVAKGFPVIPVPGPSAVVAAVSAAGFVSEGFVFLGF